MGKAIIGIIATLAICWVLFLYVGQRMTTAAVNVPATEHTSAFPITWMLLAFVGVGIVVWRVVKS